MEPATEEVSSPHVWEWRGFKQQPIKKGWSKTSVTLYIFSCAHCATVIYREAMVVPYQEEPAVPLPPAQQYQQSPARRVNPYPL